MYLIQWKSDNFIVTDLKDLATDAGMAHMLRTQPGCDGRCEDIREEIVYRSSPIIQLPLMSVRWLIGCCLGWLATRWLGLS